MLDLDGEKDCGLDVAVGVVAKAGYRFPADLLIIVYEANHIFQLLKVDKVNEELPVSVLQQLCTTGVCRRPADHHPAIPLFALL